MALPSLIEKGHIMIAEWKANCLKLVWKWRYHVIWIFKYLNTPIFYVTYFKLNIVANEFIVSHKLGMNRAIIIDEVRWLLNFLLLEMIAIPWTEFQRIYCHVEF